MVTTFIPQLVEIARRSNLTLDEVFDIAFDYGFVDSYGNITAEVLEQKKGSEINRSLSIQTCNSGNHYNSSNIRLFTDD